MRLPGEIVRPAVEGNGMNKPQPAPELPGYTEEEFFVGGTATSFDPVATPDDGAWTVTEGKTARYRTRVIVRRPPADKFSGTVIVEWFNVSAIESNPDWSYLAEEIGREGDAYIGVSAQAQGIEGGQTILNVQVDPNAASSLGESVDSSGLKHVDPARYGSSPTRAMRTPMTSSAKWAGSLSKIPVTSSVGSRRNACSPLESRSRRRSSPLS